MLQTIVDCHSMIYKWINNFFNVLIADIFTTSEVVSYLKFFVFFHISDINVAKLLKKNSLSNNNHINTLRLGKYTNMEQKSNTF